MFHSNIVHSKYIVYVQPKDHGNIVRYLVCETFYEASEAIEELRNVISLSDVDCWIQEPVRSYRGYEPYPCDSIDLEVA